MENKLHLSAKQKEVIKLMREGWCLYVNKFMAQAYRPQMEHGHGYRQFHMNTITGLLNKQIITHSSTQDHAVRHYYILTELGKKCTL